VRWRFWAEGIDGERNGAKSAAPYKRIRRQAEIKPAGRRRRARIMSAAITNPWVGPSESKIGQKISDDQKRATHDNRSEDDKLIFADKSFVYETA